MCGIVGFIQKARLSISLEEILNNMLLALDHRGPDDSGIWVDKENGVVLGHTRLSIVDLSPSGHQPMESPCKRWMISYNGEIYNYKFIRDRLEKEGWVYEWSGHSDTEVLLAAICMYGIEKALQLFTGMFAFALWDRKEKTLTLARDRIGEKPLYYGWIKDSFVFASELSALYEHPLWDGKINRQSLTAFMRHNYIPAPLSIFDNIHKLQPGHFLKISGNSKILVCYWDLRDKLIEGTANRFEGSPNDAVIKTEDLLKRSIKNQMIADVPVGAFLSGGIDSSTIVALMQSMSTRPVKTFTIGFSEQKYNEAIYAKNVADYLKTDHTELYLSAQETLDIIPNLPKVYSEPFADSSQIPTFLVSKLARESVTVCLSGDGGDELFGGYNRYHFARNLWRPLSFIPQPLRELIGKTMLSLPPSQWDKLCKKIIYLLPKYAQFEFPGDKIHTLAQLMRLPDKESIYQNLISHWKNPASLVLGGHDNKKQDVLELQSFMRSMMYQDLMSYLPDDVLVKVDRASMSVSLESRIPLLDHSLIEFSFTLPDSYLYREKQSKWPLRQILYKYAPRALFDRPKMGFGIPLDQWLRGPLREWAYDLIRPEKIQTQGFFDSCVIERTWKEHLSGMRNNSYRLWNILMFQAWYENGNAPEKRV